MSSYGSANTTTATPEVTSGRPLHDDIEADSTVATLLNLRRAVAAPRDRHTVAAGRLGTYWADCVECIHTHRGQWLIDQRDVRSVECVGGVRQQQLEQRQLPDRQQLLRSARVPQQADDSRHAARAVLPHRSLQHRGHRVVGGVEHHEAVRLRAAEALVLQVLLTPYSTWC